MPKFVTRNLLEQVLRADDEQPHEHVYIASSFEDLSAHVKRCAHPLFPEEGCMDYATVFRNGVDWLLEFMRLHQPATYEAFARPGLGLLFAEGVLVSPDGDRSWTREAYVRSGDRYVILEPYLPGVTIEQEGESHPAFHRYAALPLPVAQAYYARMAGLKISHEFMASVLESRVLPAQINAWGPASGLASGSRRQVANMTAALRSVCDNPRLPHASLGEAFRIVLDSRESGNYEPDGDFLLVDENSRRGQVFHVKDSDFMTLSVVEEPVRLFDEYGSHVISDRPGRFDFSSHLRRI